MRLHHQLLDAAHNAMGTARCELHKAPPVTGAQYRCLLMYVQSGNE